MPLSGLNHALTSYDAVPYRGSPFAQTHPDRLAVLAQLFGLRPEPVEKCRVLEIGCGDGGNLIPMALGLPESTFAGIDLAETAIDAARDLASVLGLRNIRFETKDLTTLSGFGAFDYIVVHGIYSWVPLEIRDRLMQVTKELLAPNGVAYISYNSLPGGHLRRIFRDMMKFRTRGTEGPEATVAAARQMVELVAAVTDNADEYHALVRKELDSLNSRDDFAVFHDDLSEEFHPVYFSDFARHAGDHGLQYLSEANYVDMREQSLGRSSAEAVERLSDDRVSREQYLDFVRGRRFRQTLLCHSGLDVKSPVSNRRMSALWFSSAAHRASIEGEVEEFMGPNDSRVKTAHPLVRGILHTLIAAAPGTLHFSDLPEAAQRGDELCEILHTLYAVGLVEAFSRSRQFCTVPGERPLASSLARWQAERGSPITSLNHRAVTLDGPVERRLVGLLDGTRTRAQVIEELSPLLEAGQASAKTAPQIARELNASIDSLGRLCLLIH